MALVIGKKDTRKIKVVCEEPGDFIAVTKHTFDAEIKILSKKDLDSLREAIKQDDNESSAQVIAEAIVDIDGVKDGAGVAMPFSPELVQTLRDTPWVWVELVSSFWVVQNGTTQPAWFKAKAKN
jgi:hypothetical protein